MRTPDDYVYNLTIPGFMTPIELFLLDCMVSNLQPGSVVVEIGSMFGRSAYCMARSNPEITLYCIDPWRGEDVTHRPPRKNLLSVFQSFTTTCPNIITKQIEQGQAHIEWDAAPVDMVFIDAAGHTNPLEWEIVQHWIPKIKSGGILAGHDCHPNSPDVIANVSLLEEMGYQKLPIMRGSKIWSFKI